jgi:hypothetical protein
MKPETRSQNRDSSRNAQMTGVRSSIGHSGFTLVELMISLFMVLLLILGINYVFRSATEAVGAGQVTNQINSDAQSSQPIVFDDLRNVSKNPPAFIISSQLVTQFLNADDAKTSSDPTVIVIDNAGNKAIISNGGVPNVPPALPSNRVHRADLIKFFAHYLYPRRTGNDGSYFGGESSNDAFVEIGHAALPANDLSQFYGPSSLPNNASGLFYGQTVPGVARVGAYASDWVLARRIMLMVAANPWSTALSAQNPPFIAPGDYYYATTNLTSTPASPYPSTPPGPIPVGIDLNNPNNTAFGANMTPLSYGTFNFNNTASPTDFTQIQSSRYDLAGVAPEQFDRIIANAYLTWQAAGYVSPSPTTAASLWWNPLIYSIPVVQSAATVPQTVTLSASPYSTTVYATAPQNGSAVTSQKYGTAMPIPPNPAFTGANYTPPSAVDQGLWYNRPRCNPTIQSPVTAASIAEMSPYFLQHCSQFIVEYAGDYMQQDANGNMTGVGPDGQVDFYLDANGNKHIRWYGMPRSTTGTPHPDGPGSSNLVLIRGFDPTPNSGIGETEAGATVNAANPNGPSLGAFTATTPSAVTLNYFTDVIPLRDYYSLYYSTLYQTVLNTLATPPPVPKPAYWSPPWEVDVNFDCTKDYGSYTAADTPTAVGPNLIAFNDPNNPPRYAAAWHDDMPAMVRILIKVDDPNNKVKDGPWYEYVFRLK